LQKYAVLQLGSTHASGSSGTLIFNGKNIAAAQRKFRSPLMSKENIPNTRAVRMLKDNGIRFTLHAYRYEDGGGTGLAARELAVSEHRIVKTLVMEDDKGNPFLVLMHGDKTVSTKNLARTMGAKSVRPCEPRTANRHTGYVVGGISPFGMRKKLKVCVEETIMDLPCIYINAGRHGLLAEISPQDLRVLPGIERVRVGIP
jgi:Cys-tRNA(Pro) deacylase